MGVTTTKTASSQQKQVADKQKTEIAQKIAQDKAQSQQRIAELEAGIKKEQQIREEQLKQRRQPSELTPEQFAVQQESPLPVISSKKKRGLFGNWTKRVKTAQDQAQPELSGRRVGG